MDAPLDESNINRFIKILQRFVTMSQFVVITHNKRTISMSDVLYGVTMEERGVSRFVSMRLSKSDTPRARHEEAPSIAEAVTA
jgi:chromosome segregation protein